MARLPHPSHDNRHRRLLHPCADWSHDTDAILTRSFLSNQQMVLPFPDRPLRRQFNAALIHSIKDPDEVRRFHLQVTWGLRPLARSPM